MWTRIFPFLGWLRTYRVEALRRDTLAGVTVALVLIPQSMACAQLAGLPSYYGLYAAFLPPMIAALFGSSPQLSTGPVTVVSLLTAASLEPLATHGTAGYIAYAISLALTVGMIQFGLGLFRLGLVVNFISHPVVNGFTNAAALIIATSQLPRLFGVSVEKGTHHYETLIKVFQEARFHTHWPTLGVGLSAFVIMVGLRRLSPRVPSVLVAVVAATAFSWAADFEKTLPVTLQAVASTEARQKIQAYNRHLQALAVLSSQRAGALDQLKEIPSRDPILRLQTRQAIEMLGARIEQTKMEISRLRQALRRLRFHRVGVAGGGERFVIQAEDGAVTPADNRTWRLRVGDGPLDESRLILDTGGEVVGSIPRGLPAFSLPDVDLNVLGRLFPFAAIISLLGFMEAISIAKAMAARTGHHIDPNQELIGQGLANLFGAFSGGYPVSGSFARSAVNLSAGAVSGISSVVASGAVMVVLLFFTPLLYHLPQSVLAAVIMTAVIGLVNVSGFIHAWRAQWHDGVISVTTFVITLAFAPHLEKGILVGVGLSLLVFLYKSMRPRVAILSRYTDEAMHDSAAFGLKECRFVAVIRFDGPLFFANASYLEDQIARRRGAMPHLRHIHIVADGINDMDASGEEALSLIVDRIRSAGMDITLSGVKGPVRAVLERTHFLEKLGEDHLYPSLDQAIPVIHRRTHRPGEEDACPLLRVCQLPGTWEARRKGNACHHDL